MEQIKVRTLSLSKGQTLFELIIALAVSVIIITGILRVVTISIQNANFAKSQVEATRLSQELLEWLRQERDDAWGNVAGRTGTWCFNRETIDWSQGKRSSCLAQDTVPGTIFRRQAQISSVSDTQLNIVVSVSWDDATGLHDSRLDTVFTDWRGEDDDD